MYTEVSRKDSTDEKKMNEVTEVMIEYTSGDSDTTTTLGKHTGTIFDGTLAGNPPDVDEERGCLLDEARRITIAGWSLYPGLWVCVCLCMPPDFERPADIKAQGPDLPPSLQTSSPLETTSRAQPGAARRKRVSVVQGHATDSFHTSAPSPTRVCAPQ